MTSAPSAQIYSFTIVRTAAAGFVDRAPYCVAILQTPEGSRVTAMVEGYEEGMGIEVGQSVQARPDPETGAARYRFRAQRGTG